MAGVELLHAVEANVVFLRLSPSPLAALREAKIELYEWSIFGEGTYRIVTGFGTTEEEVQALVRALGR